VDAPADVSETGAMKDAQHPVGIGPVQARDRGCASACQRLGDNARRRDRPLVGRPPDGAEIAKELPLPCIRSRPPTGIHALEFSHAEMSAQPQVGAPLVGIVVTAALFAPLASCPAGRTPHRGTTLAARSWRFTAASFAKRGHRSPRSLKGIGFRRSGSVQNTSLFAPPIREATRPHSPPKRPQNASGSRLLVTTVGRRLS
jgi:hypothetical protein